MMEAKNGTFSVEECDARISDILNSAEVFPELAEIPSRERLTYSNGFYVNCGALFIDIRGSSQLAKNHTRPVLGKLYRAYISECVAVMNAEPNCREVFINGDCVSGIFNTPQKSDIDSLFNVSARLNSAMQLLNWRLDKKGYTSFQYGIGVAYGRALMQKAGYKGSGINDVIWMGDVVNEASNLCHNGSRNRRLAIQVSNTIYRNLNERNRELLRPVNNDTFIQIDNYEGSFINPPINDYIEKSKAEDARNKLLYSGLASLGQPRKSLLSTFFS